MDLIRNDIKNKMAAVVWGDAIEYNSILNVSQDMYTDFITLSLAN